MSLLKAADWAYCDNTMTGRGEYTCMEMPLFSRARYPVERQSETVIDPDKGRIPLVCHAAPGVYDGRQPPPLLIANGWGEGCATLERAAAELAQSGRAVYTFNHRRSRAAAGDPEAYKSSTLETIFQAVASQQQPVTVVAHSEGAISAVRMARRLVERREAEGLAGLSLVAPAGLTQLCRPEQLFVRGFFEMMQHTGDLSLVRGLGARGLLSVALYALPHTNLGRRELREIAGTDLTDDVRFIAEAGVPVGIIACSRDQLFPVSELRDTASRLQASGVAYDEIDATHVQFISKPRVVHAILRQTELLEAAA